MSEWLKGLLAAELMVLKGGYRYAYTYYHTDIWWEGDEPCEFVNGFHDYLDNFKFRVQEKRL
ncbi:MAG: hypothetical protein JKY62_17035 [Desulfocapsa sp.]|nr:hypothetical protein [Desulfocapsa sp.]